MKMPTRPRQQTKRHSGSGLKPGQLKLIQVKIKRALAKALDGSSFTAVGLRHNARIPDNVPVDTVTSIANRLLKTDPLLRRKQISIGTLLTHRQSVVGTNLRSITAGTTIRRQRSGGYLIS